MANNLYWKQQTNISNNQICVYLVYNACTHTHTKVYTHACMHTLTCIHTHACMHTHACLHTQNYMYTHACTHVHASPRMNAFTNGQYSVNCKLISAVNPNWYNREKYSISTTMLLYIYDNIYIGNYIIDGQVTFIDIRRANTLYWLCQVCTVKNIKPSLPCREGF